LSEIVGPIQSKVTNGCDTHKLARQPTS